MAIELGMGKGSKKKPKTKKERAEKRRKRKEKRSKKQRHDKNFEIPFSFLLEICNCKTHGPVDDNTKT